MAFTSIPARLIRSCTNPGGLMSEADIATWRAEILELRAAKKVQAANGDLASVRAAKLQIQQLREAVRSELQRMATEKRDAGSVRLEALIHEADPAIEPKASAGEATASLSKAEIARRSAALEKVITQQGEKVRELIGLERDCFESGDTAGAEGARQQVSELRRIIKAARKQLFQLPTEEDHEAANSLQRHRSALSEQDLEVALQPVVRQIVRGGLPTLGRRR